MVTRIHQYPILKDTINKFEIRWLYEMTYVVTCLLISSGYLCFRAAFDAIRVIFFIKINQLKFWLAYSC